MNMDTNTIITQDKKTCDLFKYMLLTKDSLSDHLFGFMDEKHFAKISQLGKEYKKSVKDYSYKCSTVKNLQYLVHATEFLVQASHFIFSEQPRSEMDVLDLFFKEIPEEEYFRLKGTDEAKKYKFKYGKDDKWYSLEISQVEKIKTTRVYTRTDDKYKVDVVYHKECIDENQEIKNNFRRLHYLSPPMYVLCDYKPVLLECISSMNIITGHLFLNNHNLIKANNHQKMYEQTIKESKFVARLEINGNFISITNDNNGIVTFKYPKNFDTVNITISSCGSFNARVTNTPIDQCSLDRCGCDKTKPIINYITWTRNPGIYIELNDRTFTVESYAYDISLHFRVPEYDELHAKKKKKIQ